MRARTTSWFRRTAGIVAVLGLVLVGAPAAAQPIPQLALWEAHMLSYGQTHCDRMDFERTADGNSKTAVLSQALNAAYSTDADYNAPETQTAWLSREEAYGLMAHLNAERLGAAPRASTAQIAEKNFA